MQSMITSAQPSRRGSRRRPARLQRFLSTRTVLPAVQPLVELEQLKLTGHELLARGGQAGAMTSARRLFLAAESHGLAADLSRRLRSDGLRQIAARIEPKKVFLNTHPAELTRLEALIDSLATLVERYPELELTLELHAEASLTPDAYVELRHRLRALGVAVAFDGFGTGFARLLELATSPPDYVKFARRLVRALDQRDRFRRQVLRPLLDFTHSIGALPIAQGIETPQELAACRETGFCWAQGFLVGRPWTVAVPTAPLLSHHLVEKDAV